MPEKSNMMSMFSVQIKLFGISDEELAFLLCEMKDLAGYCQSSEKGGSLISVPPDFEVIEFGSRSAVNYEKWINEQTVEKKKISFYDLYFPVLNENIFSDLLSIFSEHKVFFESIEELFSVDYLEEYKKNVGSLIFSNELWIGPPWVEPTKNLDKVLFIEPGSAFGTGHHPTTQMCLERIVELRSEKKGFKKILDLGSGSGILSLASFLFLRPQKVVSLDTDLDCEEMHELNLKHNFNISKGVEQETFFGEEECKNFWKKEKREFDLIFSNIYSEVLKSLVEKIALSLPSGGRWLISGVLEGEQEASLRQALERDFVFFLRKTGESNSLSPEENVCRWVFLEVIKK